MPLKQVFKTVDDRFDVSKSGGYKLNILLTLTGYRLAIFDVNELRLLYLEEFAMSQSFAESGWQRALINSFDEHPILTRYNWAKIYLIFPEEAFTLVPQEMYDESLNEEYLRLSSGNKYEVVDSFVHKDGVVQVYEGDNKLHTLIGGQYKKTEVVKLSVSTALMCMYQARESKVPIVYCHLMGDNVYVAVFDGNKVKFFNKFKATNDQLIAYYIMAAGKESAIELNELQVSISGDYAPSDSLMNLLRPSFRGVATANRPQLLIASTLFDDVPGYKYHVLYGAAFA
jgi:hypothetical protein